MCSYPGCTSEEQYVALIQDRPTKADPGNDRPEGVAHLCEKHLKTVRREYLVNAYERVTRVGDECAAAGA